MNDSFDHVDPREILRILQGRLDNLTILEKQGLGSADVPEDLLLALPPPLPPQFDEFLERAEATKTPRPLPAGTRLSRLKQLILRAMRVYTAGQDECNDALIGSLRELGATVRRQGAALVRLETEQRAEWERRVAIHREVEASLIALQRAAEEILSRQNILEKALLDEQATAEETRRELERAAGELKRLHSRLRRALNTLNWTAEEETASDTTPGKGADSALSHEDYLAFEDRFRGSEEDIQSRIRPYVDRFTRVVAESGGVLADLPIVDAGCGRGELLRALRAAGLNARGTDVNPVMVKHCQDAGLEAEVGDALIRIEQAPDGSLAGLALIQVIEHWPARYAAEFLSLARRKLAPGGLILIETINPESLWAMRWYHLDWTHRRLYPAELTKFLLTRAGFEDIEIQPASPVEPWRGLAHVGDSDLDANFDKLNNLIFAHQDYAALGRAGARNPAGHRAEIAAAPDA